MRELAGPDMRELAGPDMRELAGPDMRELAGPDMRELAARHARARGAGGRRRRVGRVLRRLRPVLQDRQHGDAPEHHLGRVLRARGLRLVRVGALGEDAVELVDRLVDPLLARLRDPGEQVADELAHLLVAVALADREAHLLEIAAQLRGRLVPVVRVLGERPHDDAIELRVDLGHDLARRLRVAVGDLLHRLERALAAERRVARHEQVEQHAHGEEIAPAVERPAHHLLGREIPRLALDRADAADLRARPRLRDAEVDDLDHAVERHHHVLRRDVAVDEVEQLPRVVADLVRRVQAGARVDHHVEHPAERQERALRLLVREDLRDRGAVDPLHGEVRPIADLAVRQDVHHVRVEDARRGARLVEEHRARVVVPPHRVRQQLDGDDLDGAVGAPEPRGPNGGHAAHGRRK
nr:hypothetical protein [Sorangium sp. Soce836]